jgi:hypothetical protein
LTIPQQRAVEVGRRQADFSSSLDLMTTWTLIADGVDWKIERTGGAVVHSRYYCDGQPVGRGVSFVLPRNWYIHLAIDPVDRWMQLAAAVCEAVARVPRPEDICDREYAEVALLLTQRAVGAATETEIVKGTVLGTWVE